jgi:hypothetical protein
MQVNQLSYSEMSTMYKNKFENASKIQCDFAIKDIDETLALHRDKGIDNPYIAKLFCERDAAIDRKYSIK